MIKPAVLSLALLLCQCSPVPLAAAEVVGNSIVLTPQEIAACIKGGGCSLITQAQLNDIQAAIDAATELVKTARAMCRRNDL